MLQIKTTGVEDYLDGSANIKSLIIGGPGVGKFAKVGLRGDPPSDCDFDPGRSHPTSPACAGAPSRRS